MKNAMTDVLFDGQRTAIGLSNTRADDVLVPS